MLSPSQFSQPALPGMDDTPRVERAKAALPFVEHERSKWSGPIPGQQVMGVHDLGGDGPWKQTYEVDRTGSVSEIDPKTHIPFRSPGPERHVNDSRPARNLYATHGGALANSVIERTRGFAAEQGYQDPVKFLKKEEGWSQDSIDRDVARSKALNDHWDSQPLHHIRSDAPVHSAQHPGETETEKHSSMGLRASLQNGEDIQKPAWLVKKAGRLYALDGHHRMHASRQEGRATYPARVWDMDAQDKGKPKAAVSAISKMPKPKGL